MCLYRLFLCLARWIAVSILALIAVLRRASRRHRPFPRPTPDPLPRRWTDADSARRGSDSLVSGDIFDLFVAVGPGNIDLLTDVGLGNYWFIDLQASRAAAAVCSAATTATTRRTRATLTTRYGSDYGRLLSTTDFNCWDYGRCIDLSIFLADDGTWANREEQPGVRGGEDSANLRKRSSAHSLPLLSLGNHTHPVQNKLHKRLSPLSPAPLYCPLSYYYYLYSPYILGPHPRRLSGPLPSSNSTNQQQLIHPPHLLSLLL